MRRTHGGTAAPVRLALAATDGRRGPGKVRVSSSLRSYVGDLLLTAGDPSAAVPVLAPGGRPRRTVAELVRSFGVTVAPPGPELPGLAAVLEAATNDGRAARDAALRVVAACSSLAEEADLDGRPDACAEHWANAVLSPARPNGGPWVAARDDRYVWVGAALAALYGRPLAIFETWDELWDLLARTTASVAITAEPAAITLPVLTRLAGAEAGAPPAIAGLITGRTLAAATLTAAKRALYDGVRFGASVSLLPVDIEGVTSDHEWLSARAVTATRARALTATPTELLAVALDGDSIDADLNEAVLCGRASGLGPAPVAPADGQTHTCLSHDRCRRDPDGRLLRLPVDALAAKVVVSESCSGVAVAGGAFPSDLSLALGALDGLTAAYVGSIKILRSTGVGPLLANALLETGAPLGTAVTQLGRFRAAMTGDVPALVLFGDPELRLVPTGAATRTVAAPPAQGSAVRLEVPDGAGRLVCVRFEQEPAEPLALRAVRPARNGFAALVPGGDREPGALLLFGPADNALDGAIVALSAADDGAAAGDLARELDRNLAFLTALHAQVDAADGLRPTAALRSMAADLAAAIRDGEAATRVAAAAASGHPRIVALDGSSDAVAQAADARHRASAIDARLAARWPGWHMPHYLAPFYAAALEPSGPERAAGPCPHCACATFAIDLSSPRRADMRRTVRHCVRCGVLHDAPAGTAAVEIAAPAVAGPGGTIRVGLCAPEGDVPASDATALGLEGELPWLSWVAERLPGDEVAFALTVGAGTLPGVYLIVAAAFARLGLTVACRPLTVMPA
jgi:hypothetical protein